MSSGSASAWDEIQRIDYLLYQLAESVSLGEIDRDTYWRMSARHLARRSELVSAVEGVRPVAPAVSPSVFEQRTGASTAPQRPAGVVRKPVPWTTVLTFLGAFLVIVAAAVFALVAWKSMGTAARLAFLGSLTLGFYAAGWWARTRLEVPAGAVALTVVASTMLLFDGWIVIDGYGFEGPLPWAVLLLACSVVYWATEVLVSERFFGVIGAAAQLAWWWLLGDGLGWSASARLAGMALVVLAWRFAAEKGRDARNLQPLATVLEYAAPITGVLLAASVIFTVGVGHGWQEVAYAAVVCAAAAFTLRRSALAARIGPKGYSEHVMAAVLQVPLLLVTLEYGAPSYKGTWAVAAILFVAALCYVTYGLLEAGSPFFVAALFAEALAVRELTSVLGASDRVSIAVFAVLAVAWTLAAKMASADSLRERGLAPVILGRLTVVAHSGALVLLAGCSISAVFLPEVPALPSNTFTSSDTVLMVAVLSAWTAALLLLPHRVSYVATLLFGGYTGAVLGSWLVAGRDPALWALVPVLVPAVMLLTLGWASQRFSERFASGMRWLLQAEIVLVVAVGLAEKTLATSTSISYSLSGAALALAVCLVFTLEARLVRLPRSASAAAVFAVIAGALAGGTLPSKDAGAAIAAAAVALAIALTGQVASRRQKSLPATAGVAGAVAGSLLVMLVADRPGPFAVGLAMVAAAWVFCAYSFDDVLIVPSGLALFASVAALCAHFDSGPWVTVSVTGLVALLMGVPSFSADFGPGGRRRVMGWGLAMSGIAGLAALLIGGSVCCPSPPSWLPNGEHPMALGMMVLATALIAQSVRWKFEPAVYAGWLVALLAVWTEVSAVPEAATELYTTSLAGYLVLVGIISRWHRTEPAIDRLVDASVMLVGLGAPLAIALSAPSVEAASHSIWVMALSIVAIVAGIVLKVRWYFFGGVAAMGLIALYRSLDLLVDYWWLVLGVIGVLMLVVALTWEQQKEGRGRLRASLTHWR